MLYYIQVKETESERKAYVLSYNYTCAIFYSITFAMTRFFFLLLRLMKGATENQKVTLTTKLFIKRRLTKCQTRTLLITATIPQLSRLQ